MPFFTKQMTLESSKLNEINQTKKDNSAWYHLWSERSQIHKNRVDCQLPGAVGQREWGDILINPSRVQIFSLHE